MKFNIDFDVIVICLGLCFVMHSCNSHRVKGSKIEQELEKYYIDNGFTKTCMHKSGIGYVWCKK